MAGKGADLAMILSARDEGVSSTLGGVEKTLGGFGEKLKSAFSGLVALDMLDSIKGLGTAVISGAIEAADQTGRLQAQLGLTAEEAQQMSSAAQAAFRGGFGESAAEANAAVVAVTRNLGQMGPELTQVMAQNALTIKDLFGASEEESSRTVGVMLKNFEGLSQTDAFDLMTAGFQQGGDYSGELLDTMREYSPQFAKMGMSAEQMMGVLIAGTKAGAFNLDKVGDAVKEFAIRSIDGSKTTAEGFAAIGLNADDMAAKIAKGGASSEQAFQATLAGLAAMEDPVKRNAAGVALFGTQWEDIGPKVVASMAEGMKGVDGFQGATDRAANASFGLAGQWESMKRTVMGFLVDAITPLMPAVTAFVSGAIGGLSNIMQVVKDIGAELAHIFGGGDDWEVSGAILDQLFPADVSDDIMMMVSDLGAMFDAVFAGDIPGLLKAAQSALLEFGGIIVAAVEGWASAFAAWVDGADTGMMDGLGAMIVGLLDWIQTTGYAIVSKLAVWAGAFVDWVAPKIPPLLAALGGLLAELLGWLVSVGLPRMVAQLLTWGAALVEWVAPRIPPLLAALGGLLLALGGWLIGTALPAIVSQLLQWGDAFTAWVIPMIPQLIVQLLILQAQLILWIAGQVAGIGVALAAWGAAFLAWVATDVLPGLPGVLGEILSAILGWISGAAGSVRAGAASIGQAIVDGIASAISAGVGAIRNAAANAANSALESAKAALGIESPSKVFRDQVGKMIPAGVIEGIDAMQGAVGASLGGLVQPSAALPAYSMSPAYAGGYGGGQSVVVNVTVQGNMVHERELETVIGQAVANQLRYGGRLGLRG